MTHRIGDLIIAGELINTKRNRVWGWVAFGEDEGLRFELAGNLEGELAGKHLRFEVPPELRPTVDASLREAADKLQGQQFGVVGSAVLRTEEKPSLYFEWFGPNGHIVVEIANPQIAYGPEEEAPTEEALPEADEKDDAGIDDALPFYDREETAGDDDPYELFPSDLEGRLQESREEGNIFDGPPADLPEKSAKRPWDEVIPGIDPETKKMYEEWDEVLDGEHDEPVVEMFDPPLTIKPVSKVEDEAEAEELLKVLLARLALHSVAIDICEHFTPFATYQWLLEEILPEARIHPRAGASGFVCHYSTWELCPQCEAEFDEEYERRKREKDDDAT